MNKWIIINKCRTSFNHIVESGLLLACLDVLYKFRFAHYIVAYLKILLKVNTKKLLKVNFIIFLQSPWKQYFLDNEIKSTIKQDLDRL